MIVLVYGYDGSSEGHWQRLLARELKARGVSHAFPELSDPLEPRKDRWVAQLAEVVATAGDDPVTFVAHSLGCWAVDHYLSEHGAHGIHGALLVAPPSPFLMFEAVQTFFPPAMATLAWRDLAPRAVLVASDDDDYASSDEHAEIATTLGIEHRVVSEGGHLNPDSGYGPWDLPMQWLDSIGALPTLV